MRKKAIDVERRENDDGDLVIVEAPIVHGLQSRYKLLNDHQLLSVMNSNMDDNNNDNVKSNDNVNNDLMKLISQFDPQVTATLQRFWPSTVDDFVSERRSPRHHHASPLQRAKRHLATIPRLPDALYQIRL